MGMLRVRDEGSGSAVLLIHGFPFGGWMWEPQVRALAVRRRVLVPDLRGFGASPLPEPSCGIDDYADDLVALLLERGIGEAAVVGLSMGGYVALSLAERHPDLLSALVLANTRAAADSEAKKKERTISAEKVLAEGSAPIAEGLCEKLFAPAPARSRPALLADARRRMASVAPEAIACALCAMRDRPDRSHVLAKISVPSLVITGAEDVLMAPSESEAMARAIPGARFVAIPGAGHASNLDAPEAFNQALAAFLDEALEPRRASELARKACVPCKGGVPPLRGTDLRLLEARLGNRWRVVGEHHLEKEFKFKNFRDALAFTNRVGEIAEHENHHPEINLAWGRAKVTVWTHKIDGLTESDFVFAAKVDELA